MSKNLSTVHKQALDKDFWRKEFVKLVFFPKIGINMCLKWNAPAWKQNLCTNQFWGFNISLGNPLAFDSCSCSPGGGEFEPFLTSWLTGGLEREVSSLSSVKQALYF